MPTKAIKYRRPWMAPYQLESIWSTKRYSIIEASTKAGKTAGCLVWLAEQAMAGKSGRNYWWIAPVHRQSMIAYRRMKRGLARGTFTHHDTEQRITLANGAHMWFLSAEKPDNLYGEDVFAAVMDEASRSREAAWHAVRSTLTATKGPIRIIGNVRGRGTWAYRLGREAQRGAQDMHYAKITATDAVEAGILSEEEIADAKRRLPEGVFRELYLAEAADIQGRVYRSFSPENISADAVDGGIEVLVGMDFNVNPMTAVLARRVANQLHVHGEIVLHNANTELMAEALKERFPNRKIIVYPDPSGNARKTSAPVGQTDFTILRKAGFEVVAQSKAPAQVDRINEVNTLFCNAVGERNLFIHPDCDYLIDCVEGLMFKDGTSQPDKSLGLDHAPDALGYLVHEEFPIVDKGSAIIKLKGH